LEPIPSTSMSLSSIRRSLVKVNDSLLMQRNWT
jgi:hypothetical protein